MRFHEVAVLVMRKSTAKVVADLEFMGDFGRAEAFENKTPLRPTTCPNQHEEALNAAAVA